MKRLITASCVLAFFVAGSPAAARVGEQCPTHPLYAAQAHARAMFAGSARIPRREYEKQIALIKCQRDLFDQGVVRRDDRRLHAAHSARVAARIADAGFASSDDDVVPGVPEWFAACVGWYESTDGQNPAAHGNRYGILGGGGTGTLEQQKRAFAAMYAARGEQPWSPYDGCGVTRFNEP